MNDEVFMKTKKTANHSNGHNSPQALIARAAATQKIADAARKHFKMLKAEYKQARKSFKQARKAARRACKEAKAAAKGFAPKRAIQKARSVNGRNNRIVRSSRAAARSTIPLPAALTPQIAATA